MLDAGQTAIAGKVWFVAPAVRCGWEKVIEIQDEDDIFRTVTDEMELGDVPAVIVDPRGDRTEVRSYPKGLGAPDDCVLVRLYCSDVDLQQLCEVIESVYRQCLITPDSHPRGNKLWEHAGEFRPHRDAEHKVQAYLKPAFAAAFPTCRIYDEFAGTLGRADLHLEEPDPINRECATFLAVLELKVLRSFSDGGNRYSNSDVVDWVEKGVKQAGMYRRERGHRSAVLCCFDMRIEDTGSQCFEEVGEVAATLEVALRRWYLYASSELARDAGALNDPSPV